MRANRLGFWLKFALLVTGGVIATVVIGALPFTEIDPVGDLWQASAMAGWKAIASNRFEEAERDCRVALVIGTCDPSRPDLRRESMRSLVTALWGQGRYGEATEVARQAIRMSESEYGAHSKELIDPLIELSDQYRSVGQDSLGEVYKSQAHSIAHSLEPAYKRAVEIEEARSPASEPAIADKLIDLGDLYMDLDRADLAEDAYSRAVVLRERSEPRFKEGTIRARRRLAWSSVRLRKFESAAVIYHSLLPPQEAAFGPKSSLLIGFLEPLANTEYRRGNYAVAESLYQRSVGIRETEFGGQRPELIPTLARLASCYSAQNRFDEALETQARAVSIGSAAYGPNHIDVAHCVFDLATIQANAGRLPEAKESATRALTTFSSVLGREHPTTAQCTDLLNRLSGPNIKRESPPLRHDQVDKPAS